MLSFYLKTAPVIKTHGFEISCTFRLCAFIQRFQFPFLEESVKIIIADYGAILQKQQQGKCYFFENTCGRSDSK